MKRILLAIALSLLWINTAFAQLIGVSPTDWYFIASDTNPTTQVFSTARGIFVSNTDSSFLTWLSTNGLMPVSNAYQVPANAVNNGSGLCRLTVGATANYQTGQQWHVAGINGATGCVGNFAITVIDSTHLDLQSSTFGGAFTSSPNALVTGASTQAPGAGGGLTTTAAIYAYIQGINIGLFNAGGGYQSTNFLTINSGTHTTLTNPMSSNINIVGTGSGGFMNIDLPQADLIGSYPVGIPFSVTNANDPNSSTVAIKVWLFGGSIGRAVVPPGQSCQFYWYANASTTGNLTNLGCGVETGAGAQTQMLVGGSGSSVFSPLVAATAGRLIQDLGAGAGFGFITPGTGFNTAMQNAVNTAGGMFVPSSALTQYGIVYGGGSGGSPVAATPCTSGQVFLGVTSAAPICGTVSGDGSITNTGALTVTKINGVDQTTAWTTYTPTVTCGSGTLTTSTASGRYKILGKTVSFSVSLTDTTNGTCATNWTITLPPGAVAAAANAVAGEDFNSLATLNAGINSGSTTMFVVKYDGTYPGVSGHVYNLSGVIEQQ